MGAAFGIKAFLLLSFCHCILPALTLPTHSSTETSPKKSPLTQKRTIFPDTSVLVLDPNHSFSVNAKLPPHRSMSDGSEHSNSGKSNLDIFFMNLFIKLSFRRMMN